MNGDETKEGNYGQREGMIHQFMGNATPPLTKKQLKHRYFVEHKLVDYILYKHN